MSFKTKVVNRLNTKQKQELKRTLARLLWLVQIPMRVYGRWMKTPLMLAKNASKAERKLEIGPGPQRIDGFETVNVIWARHVDYIADASRKLPFADNTFDVVYASHILEHIPWYQTQQALEEWVRVLKPGGALEIWVPNGLLIARTFVEAEDGTIDQTDEDGWYKFNPHKDACLWANGRIFSYGDGTGSKADPNWHLAVFSPRYLKMILSNAGLVELGQLERTQVRGYDHGWINLGFRGCKP